jgi:single-stranded DNA-specific DHH superfamily exonuclease
VRIFGRHRKAPTTRRRLESTPKNEDTAWKIKSHKDFRCERDRIFAAEVKQEEEQAERQRKMKEEKQAERQKKMEEEERQEKVEKIAEDIHQWRMGVNQTVSEDITDDSDC